MWMYSVVVIALILVALTVVLVARAIIINAKEKRPPQLQQPRGEASSRSLELSMFLGLYRPKNFKGDLTQFCGRVENLIKGLDQSDWAVVQVQRTIDLAREQKVFPEELTDDQSVSYMQLSGVVRHINKLLSVSEPETV